MNGVRGRKSIGAEKSMAGSRDLRRELRNPTPRLSRQVTVARKALCCVPTDNSSRHMAQQRRAKLRTIGRTVTVVVRRPRLCKSRGKSLPRGRKYRGNHSQVKERFLYFFTGTGQLSKSSTNYNLP